MTERFRYIFITDGGVRLVLSQTADSAEELGRECEDTATERESTGLVTVNFAVESCEFDPDDNSPEGEFLQYDCTPGSVVRALYVDGWRIYTGEFTIDGKMEAVPEGWRPDAEFDTNQGAAGAMCRAWADGVRFGHPDDEEWLFGDADAIETHREALEGARRYLKDDIYMAICPLEEMDEANRAKAPR